MQRKEREEAAVHEPVPGRDRRGNRGGDDPEVLCGEFHTVPSGFVVSSASSNSASVLLSQEEDVVFRCEWCEGSRSVLCSSLESLPR